MIHSMAGGVVREKRYFDFAKVRLEDGNVAFYINNIPLLQVGDKVIVEYGNEKAIATVLRIDKNVREDMAPIPLKRAKEILKKVD